jgi:hypothetical protein
VVLKRKPINGLDVDQVIKMAERAMVRKGEGGRERERERVCVFVCMKELRGKRGRERDMQRKLVILFISFFHFLFVVDGENESS